MLVGATNLKANLSAEAISRAIKKAGSASALAKKMSVTKQLIHHWRLKTLPPLDFGVKIFVATDGEVGADEVCPHYAGLINQFSKLVIRKYRRRKTGVMLINAHQKK